MTRLDWVSDCLRRTDLKLRGVDPNAAPTWDQLQHSERERWRAMGRVAIDQIRAT